jgi:hypothetical protein
MQMRRLVAPALVAGAVAGFLVALLRPRPRQPQAASTATGVPTSPGVVPAADSTLADSTLADSGPADSRGVDVAGLGAQELAGTDAGPGRVARG